MSFLHGIKVFENTDGARPIPLVMSSIIGICGTSDDADSELYPIDKPVMISSFSEAEKLGSGWLRKAVNLIFSQIKTPIIVVRKASNINEDEEIFDIAGDIAQKTGVFAFLNAKNLTNNSPALLVAEHSNNQLVAESLKTAAAKLNGTAIIDCPNSLTLNGSTYNGKEAAKKYGTIIADKNSYLVWPRIKIKGSSEIEIFDASPAVAGLFAKTDSEEGIWTSPSNHVFNSVLGTEMPVDFELSDASCLANELNNAFINTIVCEQGYRLWGNTTTASDEKWRFISVKRTSDMIRKSLLAGMLWAVDKGIRKTFVEDVAAAVKGVFSDLIGRGAILGGDCWADPEKNPPSSIQQGRIVFSYKFTPVYPAQSIEVEEILTDEYIATVFK